MKLLGGKKKESSKRAFSSVKSDFSQRSLHPTTSYTFSFFDDIIDFESYFPVHMGRMGSHFLEESINGNPFSGYCTADHQ
jgi:hypothetical protein